MTTVRLVPKLLATSLVLCACSATLVAQSSFSAVASGSVHAITSLPKAPGDTDTAPLAFTPDAGAETVSALGVQPALAMTPSIAEAEPGAAAPEIPVPMRAVVASQAIASNGKLQRTTYKPFSAVAVAATMSVGGFGLQVATPLNRQLNLRATGVFFGYSGNFDDDGINIVGDLKFRSVGLSLDYFPFHGGFHISPGLILYNGNNLNATATVPGGHTFELNDQSYTSSTANPVKGLASVTFGNRTAPSLTVGFDNMIPRSGRRFSFPVDVGFEYIGQPKLSYTLTGDACNSAGCMSVQSDPIRSNVQAEQDKFNSDISALRFYPILSIGVGYRF